jgi:hypothetical protein
MRQRMAAMVVSGRDKVRFLSRQERRRSPASALPVENIDDDPGIEKVELHLLGRLSLNFLQPMRRMVPEFTNECFRSTCQFWMICVFPASGGIFESGKLFATLKFGFQHFDDETPPMFPAGNLLDSGGKSLGNRNHGSRRAHIFKYIIDLLAANDIAYRAFYLAGLQSPSRILTWAEKLNAVYVYFDNYEAGYAARDALRLREMLGI